MAIMPWRHSRLFRSCWFCRRWFVIFSTPAAVIRRLRLFNSPPGVVHQCIRQANLMSECLSQMQIRCIRKIKEANRRSWNLLKLIRFRNRAMIPAVFLFGPHFNIVDILPLFLLCTPQNRTAPSTMHQKFATPTWSVFAIPSTQLDRNDIESA
jgi:hypothetical protein